MKLSPRAWPSEGRALAAAASTLAAFALLVWVKGAFLAGFLAARPWSGVAALVLLAAAVSGARRAFRTTSLAAWSVGAPLLAILLVLLVSTPMPYELRAVARDLPHPEGTVLPEVVESASMYKQGHPVATVVFRYAPERPLADVARETEAAFRDAGWRILTAREPQGEGASAFAYVAATRGHFTAGCTLGMRTDFADHEGPLRTVGCLVTV